MIKKLNYLWKVIGPIALSVLSFCISFLIIQPIALRLDETFNLLANRGTGKIAFSIMAIYTIVLFLSIYSKEFVSKFVNDSIYLFTSFKCVRRCSLYFSSFFTLHMITLLTFYLFGYANYVTNWGIFSFSLLLRILFGFGVAFLLAWSEELIFRGMLYNYFSQFFKPLTGIIITSFLFMLVHDLRNPLNLLTTHWKLGLGLFLLGMLFNIIFVITGKLYASIGAHMGLVSVKVFFRRAPMLKFLSDDQLPIWVNSDLRQSILVQLLFLSLILALIYIYKDRLTKTKPPAVK